MGAAEYRELNNLRRANHPWQVRQRSWTRCRWSKTSCSISKKNSCNDVSLLPVLQEKLPETDEFIACCMTLRLAEVETHLGRVWQEFTLQCHVISRSTTWCSFLEHMTELFGGFWRLRDQHFSLGLEPFCLSPVGPSLQRHFVASKTFNSLFTRPLAGWESGWPLFFQSMISSALDRTLKPPAFRTSQLVYFYQLSSAEWDCMYSESYVKVGWGSPLEETRRGRAGEQSEFEASLMKHFRKGEILRQVVGTPAWDERDAADRKVHLEILPTNPTTTSLAKQHL